MLFYIFFPIISCIEETYWGSWHRYIEKNIIDQAGFQCEIRNIQIADENEESGIEAKIVMDNSTHTTFLGSHFSAFGIFKNQTSEFFLFFHRQMKGLNKNQTIKSIKSYSNEYTQISKKNQTNSSISETNYLLTRFNETYHFFPFIFHFKVNQTNISQVETSTTSFSSDNIPVIPYPFLMRNQIFGSLTITDILNSRITKFSIKAKQINIERYNVESRLFGAFTGVAFALYILISLNFKFNDYRTISPSAIRFICAYDLGFSQILFSIGSSYYRVSGLYSFIGLAHIYISIYNIMKHYSKASSANTMEFDNTNDRRRIQFFVFLFNSIFIYFLTTFLFHLIEVFPLYIMIYLYSFWIPQILHSMKLGQKNNIPILYVIGVTLCRLLEISYSFFHHPSMINIESKAPIFIALVWSGFQVLIIWLQNKYGGAFFLPKDSRPTTFDYYAERPPPSTECTICQCIIGENEVAVVTPCKHAFHDSCLRRWMQEKPICPLCRASLPVLTEPENML